MSEEKKSSSKKSGMMQLVNGLYFGSLRQFVELLTEILDFLDKEVLTIFDKFEVLK